MQQQRAMERIACESSDTGAQHKHAYFEQRARQLVYADLPDEDSASRPKRREFGAQIDSHQASTNQTETHFAFAAKNVKQHFAIEKSSAVFLLQVRVVLHQSYSARLRGSCSERVRRIAPSRLSIIAPTAEKFTPSS
jgi:hypothetical protein